ncbi:MAG: SpoIIE family protein phosphatase [Fibrobacterota bacterium]
MNTPEPSFKKYSYVLNNSRPQIGLLIESMSGSYQSGIWPGILEVAREHDLNVICFTGGALMKSPDDPWEKERNVLYDIAEKSDLDGLLISGTLCSYISEQEIRRFVERFSHLPVVSLLPLSPKIPSVSVNNRTGMEELVKHLAEMHDNKRYAFIKGPVGNPEADERLSLLSTCLKEYGLQIDEGDKAPGDFTRESGKRGIRRFLENGNGGILYDVIVCADDETAYGAIEELRRNGISVPEDVAVVGFDDEDESSYITPPLTTIRQPFHELGRRACELLVSRMRSEEVPTESLLDAKLIVRQSCGCFEHSLKRAFIKKALIESVSARHEIKEDTLFKYVIRKVAHSYESLVEHNPGIESVIPAFCTDVNTQKSDVFLQEFDRVGRADILRGSNLTGWKKVFSSLWHFSLSSLDRETFSFADALLHRARVIRSNLILRAQGYRRIQAQREYAHTHEIGEQIANTVDLERLLNLVSESFPELGLRNFFVTFYNDPDAPLDTSRLAVSVNDAMIETISTDRNITFKTPRILPPGVISSNRAHTIISEPLYFHNELFGVIYFLVDTDSYDENIFEVLGNYFSTALHTRYLIERVQNQADRLQEQNTELQKLREKEKEHLDSIKTELEIGRRIQRSFLPQEIYNPPGYSIDIFFRPAREVSGDFYDVVRIDDNRVGLIIADVSGKDVGAALFMSIVKTLLRVFGLQASKEGKSPLETVSIVNDYVIEEHQQPHGRCMFATMFYGILDCRTGKLDYVNAGHNSPLIVSPDGTILDELKTAAPAIGLAPNMDFPIRTVQLGHGDFLFSYTDGVTEAQDSEGNFFTLKRVTELLDNRDIHDASGPLKAVQESLDRFIRGAVPFDDITMVGLYRE